MRQMKVFDHNDVTKRDNFVTMRRSVHWRQKLCSYFLQFLVLQFAISFSSFKIFLDLSSQEKIFIPVANTSYCLNNIILKA